ncbi:MAG: twin-arginine translocase TatA/TatE family subunit [Chloroflexi bacterium]|nr:twin-arginine translocase TatA/TatE family subunit [Chloroflexota bacterium]
MIPGIGPWELLIVLLIVVVIFGAGRLGDIGGALGKGIREFRHNVKDETDPTAPKDAKE